MKKRISLLVVLALLMMFSLLSSANAITITITTSTNVQWSGTYPKNPDADDVSSIVQSTVELLYKQDLGVTGTEGSYSGSYNTTFASTPTDPEDAEITYVNGQPVISGAAYLLVKDGASEDPIWYLYDLSKLYLNLDGDPSTPLQLYAWNGTDTIDLDGFWVGNGAISHVSIYGTHCSVPEPFTMLLLGLGLVGLAGVGRKLKK